MTTISIPSSDCLSDVLGKPPVLSSKESNWQGVSFEENNVPAGESPEFCFTHHAVGVNISQHLNCGFKAEGKRIKQPLLTGDFMIIPAGLMVTTTPDRPTVSASLNLSHKLLARNALELWGNDKFELIPHSRASDSLVPEIMKVFKSEVHDNSGSCPFYAETMANALAIHLLKNFSNRSHRVVRRAGSLSRQKLKVVLDYIDSHLGQKIELAELAALVDYSQYHFSRAFKNSTGLSPYQYVIQQRIELAKQLLLKHKITISEVSLASGFNHQSHLNRHFKRLTGTTPQAFKHSQISPKKP